MPLDSGTGIAEISVDLTLTLQAENPPLQGHNAGTTGDPIPNLPSDPLQAGDPQLLVQHPFPDGEQGTRALHHIELVTSGVIRLVSLNNRLAVDLAYAPRRDPLTGEFTAVRLCVGFQEIGQPPPPP